MDYSNNPPLGLEPPKLCCIPARPLVCVLSVLGAARGIGLIIISTNWGDRVTDLIFVFLNLLLLFGAAWNNEPALKWSQRVVAIAVVLAVLQFMIWPVMFASFTASGLADTNKTMFEVEDVIFKTQEEKKKMFYRGMLSGYALEFGTVLLIGGNFRDYFQK